MQLYFPMGEKEEAFRKYTGNKQTNKQIELQKSQPLWDTQQMLGGARLVCFILKQL